MVAKPVIAIAGATGLVGNEMLTILEQRKVPCSELRLFASADSAGEVYKFHADEVVVEELGPEVFQGVDFALFALQANLAAEYASIAASAGCRVIDNSSHFRMNPEVPLVVPEVNLHAIRPEDKIIANPNCSTIQLMPVLKVVHQAAGLKRVIVSTYQSVSGAGKAALDELFEQTRSIFSQKPFEPEAFLHQIAFNCIPAIDVMCEDGYTREERKIIQESRKILELPDLRISATAVRVPVFHGHAESVNIETESELSVEAFLQLLEKQEGVQAVSDPTQFPMQIGVAGKDDIYVGRVRRDDSVEHGLNLWIVADNIRKGAALNAVQILEHLLK